VGPLQGSDDAPYVSTGHLPSPEQVRRSVDEAYARYRMVAEGERSRVYPALARVPAGLFGICAVGTSGSVDAAGDAGHGFAVMSVAKPFVFALVCQALGPEEARDWLGRTRPGWPSTRSRPWSAAPTAAPTRWSTLGRSLPPAWHLALRRGPVGFLRDGLSRFLSRRLGLTLFASEPAT